jgi:ComF family protein
MKLDPAVLRGRHQSAQTSLWWGSQCHICHHPSDAPVCVSCQRLWLVPRSRCSVCGLPGAGRAWCKACHAQPLPQTRTWVAFDYAFPWDGLIQAWKFAKATGMTGVLASALAQAMSAHWPLLREEAVVLVPVPLSARRLQQRGYNQSALLAAWLARHSGLAWHDQVLSRPVDRPHQATLTRAERQQNLDGAFLVEPRWRTWLDGRTVMLVDDVITTGATTAAAARELLRTGARDVWVCALARTP